MVKIKKFNENSHDDIDPYGEENWGNDNLENLFLNHYKCTCGFEWNDVWGCIVDDECPICGITISPYESEDI